MLNSNDVTWIQQVFAHLTERSESDPDALKICNSVPAGIRALFGRSVECDQLGLLFAQPLSSPPGYSLPLLDFVEERKVLTHDLMHKRVRFQIYFGTLDQLSMLINDGKPP